MDIIKSGAIKPLTEIERAFAHAAHITKPKQYKNPDTVCNGTTNNFDKQTFAQQQALLKSAYSVRQKLIEEVEQYTGKPIAQFAEEVRAWRKSIDTRRPLRFPKTAYVG